MTELTMPGWERALRAIYARIEAFFKLPHAGPVIIAFVGGWATASFLSHGQFDPGLSISTNLQTSFQTFMVCLSCYMIGKGAAEAHEHHRITREHVSALHRASQGESQEKTSPSPNGAP